MKTKILTAIIILIFLEYSCVKEENEKKQKPIACFVYTPKLDIEVNDTVRFTNCSEFSTDFSWDFGDGEAVSNENPEHIFKIAGTYIIRLTCINTYGSDTISDSISIDEFDIRKNYIGKYQVVEKINSYGPCWTYSSEKDTVIIVDFGITDSTLSVLERDVYLDSLGRFGDYHYGLRLWNDSISSYYMNGGLGCGNYEEYDGYRISNTQ